MADVEWADVVALQSNLSAIDPAVQDMILEYVNEGLNPAAFDGEDGPRYMLARVYLAAHLGEMARQGAAGVSGVVSSETISSTSISLTYANASGDVLLMTRWGSLYYEMLQASPLRIGITTQ